MTNLTLHLRTTNLGTNFRTGINPFTGKTITFPLDDGLTEAERTSLKALLSEMRASDADPDGYRRIQCDDGGRLSIGIRGIDGVAPFVSCDIEIDELSDDVISNIFQLARSGNMAICSSTDPVIAALTTQYENNLVASRWPNAKIVISSHQLGSWLMKTLLKKSNSDD